jgi:Suppressor of fused protein (SUFU)
MINEMSAKNNESSSLISHMETFLGSIECGWKVEDALHAFQIVKCSLGSEVALCTLGLSDFPLVSRASGKRIRHELLFLFKETEPKNSPTLLQELALSATSHNSAFLQGEVISRSGVAFAGTKFTSFCAISPAILPDEFAVFSDYQLGSIVFVWMVPITANEAAYVREHGWSRLESIFIDKGIDLTDLLREEAV